MNNKKIAEELLKVAKSLVAENDVIKMGLEEVKSEYNKAVEMEKKIRTALEKDFSIIYDKKFKRFVYETYELISDLSFNKALEANKEVIDFLNFTKKELYALDNWIADAKPYEVKKDAPKL